MLCLENFWSRGLGVQTKISKVLIPWGKFSQYPFLAETEVSNITSTIAVDKYMINSQDLGVGILDSI